MPALPYRITISEEDVAYLKSLIKTRTIQSQVVDRARILLWKSEAKTDKAIADGLGISVNTVRRCVDRYLNSGIDLAIFDDERSAARLRLPMMQKHGSSVQPAKSPVTLAMRQNYGHCPHSTGTYRHTPKKPVIHA